MNIFFRTPMPFKPIIPPTNQCNFLPEYNFKPFFPIDGVQQQGFIPQKRPIYAPIVLSYQMEEEEGYVPPKRQIEKPTAPPTFEKGYVPPKRQIEKPAPPPSKDE